MRNYRIIEKTTKSDDIRYYPQYRWFIFWNYYYDQGGYKENEKTIEEAEKYNERHYNNIVARRNSKIVKSKVL